MIRPGPLYFFLLLFWFALFLCGRAPAQAGTGSAISLPTDLRTQSPGWWPRKGDPPRTAYVGAATCAGCHRAKAAAQTKTAMAHASVLANGSDMLREHPNLTFDLGPYHYQLQSSGNRSTFSVSRGSEVRAYELLWAFGFGHMGQTYLYQGNGTFYEAHLSFYSQLQGLDITPGQERSIPAEMEAVAGFPQPASEIRRCFSCHTTAAITNGEFDPAQAFAGVTCEACHGPGAAHVAAVTAQKGTGEILNPSQLAPVDSVDFCGACHRTWQDVVGNGLTGVGTFNVRFAPYRLESSKCWQKTQSDLLTCVACHDPHQPLVHDSGSYDSKCLQCHSPQVDGPARLRVHKKICPISKQNCVECHMPKIQPPNLHSDFTDHWIRVVRRGAPYPD